MKKNYNFSITVNRYLVPGDFTFFDLLLYFLYHLFVRLRRRKMIFQFTQLILCLAFRIPMLLLLPQIILPLFMFNLSEWRFSTQIPLLLLFVKVKSSCIYHMLSFVSHNQLSSSSHCFTTSLEFQSLKLLERLYSILTSMLQQRRKQLVVNGQSW